MARRPSPAQRVTAPHPRRVIRPHSVHREGRWPCEAPQRSRWPSWSLAAAGCGGSDEDAATGTTATAPATTTTATTTATATTEPPCTDCDALSDTPAQDMRTAIPTTAPDPSTAAATHAAEAFLRAAFDSAQDLWRRQFAAAGATYRPGHLVLFHTAVHTACGTQSADVGPFYCPADETVYLNTDFFDALARAFDLRSGFAAGYVTGHEVAHHVQHVLGLLTRQGARRRSRPGRRQPPLGPDRAAGRLLRRRLAARAATARAR